MKNMLHFYSQATILYLRGKKRLGFELNLKAKWKGKVNDKEVSGHISIPSLDSDDWPDDIEVLITNPYPPPCGY